MKLLFAVIMVLSMVSVGWAAPKYPQEYIDVSPFGSIARSIPCCISIENECRKLARDEQGIYGLVFPSKLRSQYLEETAYQECLEERCRNCFSVGDASGVLRQGAYRKTTKIITEWTTVSTTTPVRGHPTLVIHNTCNQVGKQYEITYAQIHWKDRQMEFELERKPIEHEPLSQSVTCNVYNIY